jgi:hypothetical protein
VVGLGPGLGVAPDLGVGMGLGAGPELVEHAGGVGRSLRIAEKRSAKRRQGRAAAAPVLPWRRRRPSPLTGAAWGSVGGSSRRRPNHMVEFVRSNGWAVELDPQVASPGLGRHRLSGRD